MTISEVSATILTDVFINAKVDHIDMTFHVSFVSKFFSTLHTCVWMHFLMCLLEGLAVSKYMFMYLKYDEKTLVKVES